jgi:hypothetical protein
LEKPWDFTIDGGFMTKLGVIVRGILLAIVFGSLPLHAQQFSGVNGVVSDKSGAALSGVQVTLDNPQIGLHESTATNDLGFYQFLRQTPAEGYELTFGKDGFRTVVLHGITLQVSTVDTRDATMEIGTVTQTVQVEAAGESTLDTTDATIGNVISSREVTDLPIQARLNPASLMQLQPGVNDAGSITGARSDQGNITLDGIDVNDQETGQAFSSTTPISVDSVQEIRTITAGETADFGRSSGGMINLETRGGTNNFHGNLREYNRNTLLEANDWFDNRLNIPRAPLVRNQFGGSLGGPIKKDKLFFFFDYEGLREARSAGYDRAVPTSQFRNGQLAYVNNTINPATGQPCDGTARLNSAPTCISFLNASQIAALDPQGVGANQALMTYMLSRYPAPNDPTGGDGINSEGLHFVAPVHNTVNLYTTRLDYNLSDKHKIFFRANVARQGEDDYFNNAIEQFPGDPVVPVQKDKFNSYTGVLGWTWSISPRMLNDLTLGFVRPILEFNNGYQPSFPVQVNFSASISNPYADYSSQSRNVPVPEIRDAFTITKGKHTFDVGGDFKLIRVISGLTNSYDFVTYGLGGQISALDSSLRPSSLTDPTVQISSDSSALTNYDNWFSTALGRYSSIFANFNYDKNQNALPNGSDKARYYNYNEFELYAQDSWKMRRDLTITLGLRWDYHTVPYEMNGFQSSASINENAYLASRIQAGLAGQSGDSTIPFVSYSLGGPVNHGKGFYSPDYKDFAPRLALAYNPSPRNELLQSILGNRRTTIRLGAAVLNDRIAGGASFGLDQNTFLFDSNANSPCGISGDPSGSLSSDPRFTAIGALPPASASCVAPAAPLITVPNTPNVSGGVPTGTFNGGFPSFFQFDANTKTPYSILLNLGFQRELPGDTILEVNYVGRLGRRLLAVGDAAQLVDFKDTASGQFLKAAFGQLQMEQPTLNAQVAAGQAPNIAPIAWFENQINTAIQANYGPGLTCASFGFANCASLVGAIWPQLVNRGDLSDTVQAVFSSGALLSNVGLPAQTGANGYIGNYASSSYNALLLNVRKRFSKGLQFKFNYTYSHSIDNMSEVTNNYVDFISNGAGLVCDLTNLRSCRASSDFDARHLISGDYIYDLPLGHDRSLLHDAPRWVDALVGGWSWSGIVTYRTGYPFTINTNSFPTDFTLDAPAVVSGSLKSGIHTDAFGNLQYFANPSAALSNVSYPFGGVPGNRNAAVGPGFFNVNMGISKSFQIPGTERQRLKFRWDSFNTFNHPSFNGPASATLNNTSAFGIINSTASSPRVSQLALRYEF